MTFLRHAIQMAQQAQRVNQGQVPPELRALAEDDANTRGQFAPLCKGIQPYYAHSATGRRQNARQHLDRRTLARAIGSQEADHFAALAAAPRETPYSTPQLR